MGDPICRYLVPWCIISIILDYTREGQAKRKKKVAKEAKEGEAATKIQAIHRGNLARKAGNGFRDWLFYAGYFRHELGVNSFVRDSGNEAQSKQEEEAATKIQDGRSKQPEKAAKEEEAATKIQAPFALILRSEADHAEPCKQAIHRGNLAQKATPLRA
ncbi:XI-B [Symbiodinium sp. KB8]|nr:XI-B [Symbiodinium sp. KB8]